MGISCRCLSLRIGSAYLKLEGKAAERGEGNWEELRIRHF
jgi:hypothetical protein